MPKTKSHKAELSLNDKLMAADHKKLVGILVSLYSGNSEMKKQLDIIFAGLDEDPKKLISMINKEISALKRSAKFVDYYESDSLATRLNALRLRIANDLNAKSSKIAFEIMLKFLDLHENTLNRADDSNGSIGNVFCTACEDLGIISQSIDHLSLHEIVEVVFALFMNNDYSIYDKVINNFKSALNNNGLDLLKKKLQEAANSANAITIKGGFKDIADCKNDVDEFIAACSFAGGSSSHDHLDIAKRLIKHWKGKEAIEWLHSMKIPEDHPWQQDKKELKIQALELEGEYGKAQIERLAWFEENLSPKLYSHILSNSKPDFKKEFKAEAIKKAFQFSEPHRALHFLIETQEFEEAAQFARLRFDDLSGRQYYILRPAADLMKTFDPISATLLYRKMIEPVLKETKSKYYNYAAKDLVACSILNAKITNWDNLQKHDDYFHDIETKHKRKTSFWAEYKTALQKQAAKEAKSAKRHR